MMDFITFVLGGIAVGAFGLGVYAALAIVNGWAFPIWILWFNLGMMCLALSRHTVRLMVWHNQHGQDEQGGQDDAEHS